MRIKIPDKILTCHFARISLQGKNYRLHGASSKTLASHCWGPELASPSLHVRFWWTKRSLGLFFSGILLFSPVTNFSPFLLTPLIHFLSSCNSVSGVVCRHPCYSQTLSKWFNCPLWRHRDSTSGEYWFDEIGEKGEP